MQSRFIPAAVILVAAGFAFENAAAQSEITDRWWPIQIVPKTIVRVSTASELVTNHFAHETMIQSVAGLAARAVNQGKGDEMVWVETGNTSMSEWFSRWRAAHEQVTVAGPINSWELIDRFAKRGLIKGYILYKQDVSRRDLNSYAPGMDCSVNVATSLAPILDAVIIDESLETEAMAHGLKRLEDTRKKTQGWCFERYRDRFNRRMLCTQDPKKPHARDFAITHNVFTFFGEGEPLNSIMQWLEPLSPILGWNGGDEFKTTALSSRNGHIQTATDWCMNLPVLMAGSEKFEWKRTNSRAQIAIDWTDQRTAVAFVQSDGDNVQWLEGNFFHNASYWGNPDRGRTPFGWSCCFSQLAQLAPSAMEFAVATRSANDSFLEWGGGYYYPDHFAQARSNRWELLAQQAQRTWALMRKTNTRIIGFNVDKYNSPDARKAYEVFARQTDALLGILVFQYYPYEGGAGETFWVKDRNGIDLPVVTARYAIWENSNHRPRAGTPAKIAREIRDAGNQAPSTKPRYDWVISHAWSYFKKAPGPDENAENVPQTDAGGIRGYLPVTWCAERLLATVHVVSPEELLLRMRMQHDANQTRSFLKRLD
jgi:hypothetical protein